MSYESRKGYWWEHEIVGYLQAAGFVHAERRVKHGANDLGDVLGIPGCVIEAKSHKRLSVGSWLKELSAEKENANADIGGLWVKTPGCASAGGGFVVSTGRDWTELLKAWAS